MLQVTKSGYGIEHEIKLTRSDFMADRNKGRKTRQFRSQWRTALKDHAKENEGLPLEEWSNPPKERLEMKYELLKEGSPLGPKQFYYVTPEGLIDENELPDFAGLKTFKDGRHKIKTVVKAPVLHREKVPEKVLEHARGVFYYRYWNLRT